MAICKSATRYDSDSYYETEVNEATEDVTVRGTRNGEPVEYSLGSGGGDMLVTTIHVDVVSSDNISIDKTFDELKSAMLAGIPVYARVELGQNDTVFSVSNIATIGMQLMAQIGSDDKIIFESTGYTTEAHEITTIACTTYTLLSDNTFTMDVSTVSFGGD